MDTSDPTIRFNADGICNHCHTYDIHVRTLVWTPEQTRVQLTPLIDKIRAEGRGKEYDCLIGVSGGVDSTYLAWKVRELGLRPLAVHMDNGWDAELAVRNIELTLKKLHIDLVTEVLDWDEFRDIQLAFLEASTPDAEIPSDHAIGAVMLDTALKHGIKYILGGSNIRTESCVPAAWSTGVRDWRYIKSVHARFGKIPLLTFPHYSLAKWTFLTTSGRVRRIDLLNCIQYRKSEAMDVLKNQLGWTYYGGKHYESIYTRFFQAVILPQKFGADKRRGHLSALILSGELSRERALEEMKEPPCPADQAREDREFVLKKLGLSEAEFERIMTLPPRSIADYPAYENSLALQTYRAAVRVRRRLMAGVRAASPGPVR
ncbi:MAG: N-acetyl sugar amidotransferase [Deltaproteobacteria bacterium]|nr:N-acetyl sugar amidotransferase [Deltaproteobacteria bacterium]